MLINYSQEKYKIEQNIKNKKDYILIGLCIKKY